MVFDYIDGAAGEGFAEKRNRDRIRSLQLQPRILNNVEHRCTEVNVFGRLAKLPFGVSPIGMCNLSSPHADRWLARLAAEYCIPIGVSTAASSTLESMIEWSDGNAWFQLYFSGNEIASNALIDRAQDSGYQTLIMTVDVPEVGRRPRELRRGFRMPFSMGPAQVLDCALHPRWSLSVLRFGRPSLANFGGQFGQFERTASRAGADWDLLARIRERWQGQLVVKGVLSVDDASRLQEMGVDAIQVSSHGGRQLDCGPPPIDCLAAIRKAVGDTFPLFFDSGIRSGEDLVKAYAVGADFVFLARPLLFAIAAAGEKGLHELAQIITNDASIALAQLGVTSIESLDRKVLADEQ